MIYLGYILGLFCLVHTLNAQERLNTLHSNPLLKNYTLEYSSKRQVLALPFADDFNQSSFFPNNSRWADNDVFINNTYPKGPPTLGVATFDGLNSSGEPYVSRINGNQSISITSDNTNNLVHGAILKIITKCLSSIFCQNI